MNNNYLLLFLMNYLTLLTNFYHMCFGFHQIKYAGSDTDFSASPAFCKQISRVESEEKKVIGTQTPLQELLEGLIADKELPAKDKRKRLKQVCTTPTFHLC